MTDTLCDLIGHEMRTSYFGPIVIVTCNLCGEGYMYKDHLKQWQHFVVEVEEPRPHTPLIKEIEAVLEAWVPETIRKLIFDEIAHRKEGTG